MEEKDKEKFIEIIKWLSDEDLSESVELLKQEQKRRFEDSNCDSMTAKLKGIKDLRDHVPRSDLQGIVMAKAMDIDKGHSREIEEIMLQYCDDVLSLDQAKYQIMEVLK